MALQPRAAASKCGAALRLCQGGGTPLQAAAYRGHAGAIEELLARGAALDAQDAVRSGWQQRSRSAQSSLAHNRCLRLSPRSALAAAQQISPWASAALLEWRETAAFWGTALIGLENDWLHSILM